MKRAVAFLSSLLLLFSALSLTACGGGGASNRVVIYTSMEDYRNDELKKQLDEQFPGVDIRVQYLSTGTNAAKIKAEGTNTEADIVLGLETASWLPIAEYFAPLDSFTPNDYIDSMKLQDNRAFIWEKFEGAFIVNTEILKANNLPEPKSYDDLLKPEYKGQIVMSNPKTSGTGYMFLNTWANTMGEDQAFAYVDQLQGNIKQFTESGSGPIKTLLQGEAAVGLGMVFQAAEQLKEGAPLKIIAPEAGCPYNTTVYGIIKGRENNENVKKVFDYINTEFAQYDKAHFAPAQIYQNQKVELETYPEGLQSADMSTITDSSKKQKLLDRWTYS